MINRATLPPEADMVAAFHDFAKSLTLPVLYAGGSHDVMIDGFASYAAVQELPNAKLVLYSDAGHAFLFQHLEAFAAEVKTFLRD